MCEIGLVQGEIRWMKQHLGRLCRPKHVRTPLAQFAAKSYQSPSPYGNVLIMSPWNYPVLLTLEPLVDAIAAVATDENDKPTTDVVMERVEIVPYEG